MRPAVWGVAPESCTRLPCTKPLLGAKKVSVVPLAWMKSRRRLPFTVRARAVSSRSALALRLRSAPADWLAWRRAITWEVVSGRVAALALVAVAAPAPAPLRARALPAVLRAWPLRLRLALVVTLRVSPAATGEVLMPITRALASVRLAPAVELAAREALSVALARRSAPLPALMAEASIAIT